LGRRGDGERAARELHHDGEGCAGRRRDRADGRGPAAGLRRVRRRARAGGGRLVAPARASGRAARASGGRAGRAGVSVDTRPAVLVRGGGPDAERSVSLTSSRAVTDALYGLGTYKVNYQVIHRPTPEEIVAMAGDVVFPVLHGGWGEG